MKSFVKVMRILAAGMMIAVTGSAAAQQAYPSRPIRFIAPYPPGGTINIVARLIGQKLTESWGQPVTVENRPGASTTIGADAVAKAAPDGYTLLVTSGTHIITPLLMPVPYDAIKDFAPVATISSTQTILVVHPSLPVNTLREFVALAKARPGQLNYASNGNGSSTHLSGAYFEFLAGVRMQHVPYKGGGPALVDLVGGQIQLYFALPASSAPYVKSGKLKAIAITGETRSPALPTVATFIESGMPAFDHKSWQGILAPAATPKPIIEKLSTEIAKILAAADIRQKLESQGVDPFILTPEQFAAILKTDVAKSAKLIKDANIKLE